MRSFRKGFTLIELLIVVAIIGIIVAIAVFNFLQALDRAKQKRTMADMRAIGTSAEAYAIDRNVYPVAAASAMAGVPTSTCTLLLSNYLAPTYIKALPFKDGWNSFYLYDAFDSGHTYVVLSAGKDGVVQVSTSSTAGPTTSFNDDIVFTNGQFTRFPDGAQR